MDSLLPKALLYSDGSSRGNPGPGGYGTLVIFEEKIQKIAQGFRKTTNNRMELMGIIVGLEFLPVKSKVMVYSDSKYVVDALQKGWLKNWIKKNFKGKKNQTLWERFWRTYQQHKVTLSWIKGHDGHPENEACDKMAVTAALKGPWQIDKDYEKGIAASSLF